MELRNLQDVIKMFIELGAKIIPFLATLAFLVFIWGVAKFIKASGDGKEVKESKNLLIWGVIGLFIMVSIWGIIAWLQREFGFGSLFIPQIRIK